MSDNDFIIVDEEKETPAKGESSDTEKKEVSHTPEKESHEEEYEKVCFICHRPESVTGKMIDLPNHITVCPDCMQKSFDAMTNGSIDYSRLMNMPGGTVFESVGSGKYGSAKGSEDQKEKGKTKRIPEAGYQKDPSSTQDQRKAG